MQLYHKNKIVKMKAVKVKCFYVVLKRFAIIETKEDEVYLS